MISTKQITPSLQAHPILRHATSLLDKWKGKEARLFNLTVNHRKLQLKISENRYIDDIPYLVISMHEPITMNGYFDWDNADIEIQFDNEKYKVLDSNNQVEIICQNISITEYQNKNQ
ncbi:hypothetical protein [Aquimarina litoralis]|uniref:hypothetical protein n=1 Tax=Aquimarina litoralis TaxID=584605 RepID=UPI001C59A93F|nr:hypothetical protein [Aquimarina litoralis]MBW1294146.1 hypothetical protein [Aquimarina litoralis]